MPPVNTTSSETEGLTTFTPRPWSVGRLQRSSNFAKDTYCVHGDGTVLCRVKGGVTESQEIALANARLIAAAPELLEALDWLLGCAPADFPTEGDDNERYRLARAAARNAIARATGAA